MGKVCAILATVMMALFLFPKNQVIGANLENNLERPEMMTRSVDTDSGGLDYAYDYAFLNRPEPSFGGVFPKRLSMKRHGRLMRRLRRYVKGEKSSVLGDKIPAGCCSCGDHFCCDGMCHGK